VSLIVDTSVALTWIFADEGTDETEALLDRVRDDGGVVPALWEYEVGNALLVAVRRGRLEQPAARQALTLLRAVNLQVDRSPVDLTRVVGLAATHDLSVYDAAYLDLALSRGLPLATLDDRLARAATAVGVAVLPDEN